MNKLNLYLKRLGYGGNPNSDLKTLKALHRAHLTSIPYEDIDVQLRKPASLDINVIFEKLVLAKRGGWCFEMNGLFAWALEEIGFRIRRIGGVVNSVGELSSSTLDHLVILVACPDTYLADVGFGNAFLEPLPLREGAHREGERIFHLTPWSDGWQFSNHDDEIYRFAEAQRDMKEFEIQNTWLQTSLESRFVKNLVCHRFVSDGILSLRGAIMGHSEEKTPLMIAGSATELERILETYFDLFIPNIEVLWERVHRRHLDLLRTEK